VGGLSDPAGDERAKLYLDLVLSRLRGAAKTALEELMQSGKYEYQSDFAKKYVAAGRAEGRAEGKAEGEIDSLARAVLAVLETRGVPVPPEVRERVLACRDLGALERWHARAVTVGSAAALLSD
jgi:hypothetical protein